MDPGVNKQQTVGPLISIFTYIVSIFYGVPAYVMYVSTQIHMGSVERILQNWFLV